MSLGLANTKIALATVPVALTTPWTTTPVVVDTKGYREAMFIVAMSTQATLQSALEVQEGDTTSPTTLVDGTDLKAAVAVTATGQLVVINLNLRKRKRYLRLVFTGGANVTVGTICILSKPEVSVSGGVNRLQLTATVRGNADAEAVV